MQVLLDPLAKILEARDRRECIRKTLLSRYNYPLVQIMPINPGQRKNSPLALRIQQEAEQAVRILCFTLGFTLVHTVQRKEDTGPWAMYVVNGEVSALKQSLVTLEETHPWGRLLDLDVIDTSGIPLSRRDLGYPSRGCLVCGESVFSCIREGSHSLEEILKAMEGIMQRPTHVLLPKQDDGKAKFASCIASLCREALIEEVELSPKPGLVDREDSGAHTDMNLSTFYSSIAVIIPYLEKFVLAGWDTSRVPLNRVLSLVRPIGKAAEDAMFHATSGVNTHKGAIFSLGLVCTALGRIQGKGQQISRGRVFMIASKIVEGITEKELLKGNYPLGTTKGIAAYKRLGVTGARGEAEKGFPRVRYVALQLYRMLRSFFPQGKEKCLLTVLLVLIMIVKDTNVLHRGGICGLGWLRFAAFRCLLKGGAFTPEGQKMLQWMNKRCKDLRISPGGSADLLSLTIFMDRVLNNRKLCNP